LQQDRLLPTNPLDLQSLGEWIYTLFYQRLQAGWLVDLRGEIAIASTDSKLFDLAKQKLTNFTQSQSNFISICTCDPIEFVAELMVGSKLGLPIFLSNPQWGSSEWEQVDILTAQVDRYRHQNCMMIPTGGSSGKIEFAIHTWETLSASVWGFQEFYEVEEINSVCVLPLYHVSGLMQLLRSLLTDGKLLIIDYHQLCNVNHISIPQIESEHYFISLVPTQLQKLLDLNPIWLAQFQTILIGGAPPSLELLTRSRLARLPLALTYGMTETASQISSLKPAEFLAGNDSCGKVLPHAEIRSIRLSDDRVGSIQIKARSLMLGYFPNFDLTEYFETDDLGSIDDRGYLTILGRNSGKIITGGENVLPIEVVNAIRSTGLVLDVWVVGLPDDYWGEIVTAVYVETDISVTPQDLAQAIDTKIGKYKIPKIWLKVNEIPRNSLGKILIEKVKELAEELYFSSQHSQTGENINPTVKAS
jgi:o-succinylbenzoate---CoA ligase